MNKNINEKTKDFIPLLFAGDINVYSMARAFYEAYKIKPYVYGKYEAWPCRGSRIMHYTANSKADEQDEFLKIVKDFALKNAGCKILLLGCGDSYVRLISENMDDFPENVVAPYIRSQLMDRLIHKEKFYDLCERTGVDYPETFVHRRETGHDFDLDFKGPYIVKPSNGIEYWRHPFEGQNKVFKLRDRDELLKVLDLIYESGYDDSVIIQDFIPGDDTYMRVLTNYSDQRGEVKLVSLGHVLLEEHTPHGIGNHAVIITETNRELEDKFKGLLEELKYVGFSNFDIKFDQRDGKYKAFEINTRQGRSNYYVTGAGSNLAQFVVEDFIYSHPIDFRRVEKELLWMVVPKGVAFKYIKPVEYRNRMKQLIKEGNKVNPLKYSEDNSFSRRLNFTKTQLNHYLKYRKYMK
jgi:D-aspartate ligase